MADAEGDDVKVEIKRKPSSVTMSTENCAIPEWDCTVELERIPDGRLFISLWRFPMSCEEVTQPIPKADMIRFLEACLAKAKESP